MSSKGNRITSIATAVAVLAITVGGAIWLKRQSSASQPTLAADQQGAMHTTTTEPPLVPRPSPTPLPPLDLPLASTLFDLSKRARQGDPAAACRLAAEYAHCSEMNYMRSETERWLADRQRAIELISDPKTKAAAAKGIEREMSFRDERLEKIELHCKGVSIPSPTEIAKSWRQAALLGNKSAMHQYATGSAFRWNHMMQALPELMMYKEEAERIATVAASKGDVRVTLALAIAYDPRPTTSKSLLAQTVAPDGARSLALYEQVGSALDQYPSDEYSMLRRRIATRVAELHEALSSADIERARSIASTELSNWSRPTQGDANQLDANGVTRDVSTASCGR